jgi:ribosomal protein L11 methyltransferase
MSSVKPDWSVIQFEIDAKDEELASWLMIQCGANACEIQPITPERARINACFDARPLSESELAKVRSNFEEYGLSSSLQSLQLQSVPDQDWLARWKEGFEPFFVGDEFLICPPWRQDKLTPESIGNRHVILIEPGMAFGTGLHETTQFCLKMLKRYLSGSTILDVGTGSGILSIAAAKLLGSKAKITALDITDSAIETARDNFKLNNVATQIHLLEGSTELVRGSTFGTILSNLTCEDIIALLDDYKKLLRSGGNVICAGILKEKLSMLEAALPTFGFKIKEQEVGEKWAGTILQTAN